MLSHSFSQSLVLALLSTVLILSSVNEMSFVEATIVASGRCLPGNRGEYALEVYREDGNQLEIEFEVETNMRLRGTSRQWTTSIEYNGNQVYNNVLVSRGLESEVSATVMVPNADGNGETIKARIENLVTGDVCEVTAASPF